MKSKIVIIIHREIETYFRTQSRKTPEVVPWFSQRVIPHVARAKLEIVNYYCFYPGIQQ